MIGRLAASIGALLFVSALAPSGAASAQTVSSDDMSVAEMERALGLDGTASGPRFRAPTFEVEAPAPAATPEVEPGDSSGRPTSYSFALQVEFDSGSARASDAYRPVIGRIAEVLKRNPALQMVIRGHTDAVGGTRANDALSLDRARSVRSALIDTGIAPQRLTVDGRGERSLLSGIAPDSQKNRRVEFIRRD